MPRPVQTVLGEIPVEDLGFTLPHEHVLHDMYELDHELSAHLQRQAAGPGRAPALQGGRRLARSSIRRSTGSIPTPRAWPRSRATSASTSSPAPGSTGRSSIPPLARRDERSARSSSCSSTTSPRASARPGSAAGLLGEIASSHRRHHGGRGARLPRGRRVAQREVPVPIATHALFTRVGLAQVRLLEEAGADLDKVVIGHADTTPDVDYHEELLRTGVWIAYDCVGPTRQAERRAARGRTHGARRRAAGSHRLLVSMDVAKRGALRHFGGGGYDYLIASFLPLLRERGAGDGPHRHAALATTRASCSRSSREPRRAYSAKLGPPGTSCMSWIEMPSGSWR